MIRRPRDTPPAHRTLVQASLLLLMAQQAQADALPMAAEAANRASAPPSLLTTPPRDIALPRRPDDPAQASAAADATPIPVRRVRVTGARLFPAEALEALVADLNDGTRTLDELARGAARITEHYRDHGWFLARAVLPPQTIGDGEVEIRVIEGRLAEVRVQVAPGSRIDASVLEARMAAVPLGEPLNQAQVDRTLLLLSDLPGARLKARLQAGAQPGDTTISIESEPAPLVSGRIEADNHGSRYTGQRRAGGSIVLDSPTGHSESISARLLASEGDLYYGRLAAQLPLGNGGWSTGLSVTRTQYALGSSFAELDARGQANVAEWQLSYPLIRGTALNLTAQASLERRRLNDEIRATGTATGKRATHGTLQLMLGLRDDVGAGADTRIALRVGRGHLGFTSPDAALIDSLSARTAGRYGTFNLDLQRNQRLGGGWGVLMAASGQLASRNLDSYQKFVLGGVQGLRGYPSGEAVGDEGWLASGELYYAANPAFIPSVFLGAGGVRLNEAPFLPTDNRRTLHSYGAALRGTWRTMDWTLSIAGHGAERAQSEPDRAVRVWVQAGWAF